MFVVPSSAGGGAMEGGGSGLNSTGAGGGVGVTAAIVGAGGGVASGMPCT